MAVITSDDYKNTLYLPDSIQVLTIFFDNAEVDSNLIQKIKLKDMLFDGTTFSLGSTAITELEITFDDSINVPSTIQLYYSLQTNTQKEVGSFNVGFYDVISYDNSSKGCIKVQAKDYMNRFNKSIDISSVVPCTRYELVEYLCNQCNTEIGVSSFINSDIIIDVYDNSITAQKYISYIAERAGGFARINRNGQLEILSYNDVDKISLPEAYLGEFTNGDRFVVSKVIYENGIQKYEYGDDAGSILKLSQNNILSCTDNEVSNIYQSLNGLVIESAEIKVFGDPSIDVGDVVSYGNFQTFCQRDWEFNLGFIGKYKTNIIKLDESSNMTKSNLTRVVKLINSNIDEINGTLTIQATQIKDNITQITQTKQDVANITHSIQNTGGSNLIKNSVMFAYNNDNIPNDWTVEGEGNLIINSSAEALANGSLSGHIFMLSNKTARQRVTVKVDNEDTDKTYYTFSTKIKKDATGTCYVKIFNSNEEYKIELSAGESSFYGDYEIKALLPKDSYYDIEFYGSADSNATFTDTMLAIGEYKTQWSQASGEIMNTQVNINVDGVLVKSSVYDGDYTIMSPIEFAGYSNINGTITRVFSLNKDITLIKKLEAENGIKMAPIKIIPITTGELQGWAFVPSTGGDI